MDLLVTTANSLWQVILVGLLLGAGLPALFALGLRSLAAGSDVAADGTVTRRPLAVAGAVACFAIIVIAIVVGILFVMSDFLNHTFGIELF
ncbi:hypothetical protein [Rhodococcus tukisamuensis]|uniref:Uncharacterized protein n=1 Tax=Rhodococcus tukisamuensis TaxID=168276 RepID=A0A1G6WHA6_9NOCA|nr:hypothetical protein [Rhodococcus tukisamuensis]SDD65149.1 hypothetical protein SAMN05444580_105367 [Rhodococcus tukisamuensis]